MFIKVKFNLLFIAAQNTSSKVKEINTRCLGDQKKIPIIKNHPMKNKEIKSLKKLEGKL